MKFIVQFCLHCYLGLLFSCSFENSEKTLKLSKLQENKTTKIVMQIELDDELHLLISIVQGEGLFIAGDVIQQRIEIFQGLHKTTDTDRVSQ